MKSEIHPEVRDVIFQDSVSGALFKMTSVVKTNQTIELDGQELPLVKVDVSSASHPFYTGNQRIIDTAGRVEKFGNKFGKGLTTKMLKKKK